MRGLRLPLVAAFLLAAVALHVVIRALRAFFSWASGSYYPFADLAAGIVSWLILGLGGIVAAGIYHLLRARSHGPRPSSESRNRRPRLRSLLWPVLGSGIALAWAATAFVGVPAVITSLASSSISAYKPLAARQPILLSLSYPRIEASVAVPVLPGVILVSYGAQLAGQAGGGGWHLYVWWGSGSRELYSWTRWMS